MENILWNTWQYLVDVFDCFLILYLFRKMMRTRLRQPKYYYLFQPDISSICFLPVLPANYEKHALLVSRVIAVLVKSACKHAIFLATRVKEKDLIEQFLPPYKVFVFA